MEPNNEEAMYILINVELENSNFSKVKKLNEKFKLICSSLCPKISCIASRIMLFPLPVSPTKAILAPIGMVIFISSSVYLLLLGYL